jgi:hypothetical protein
MRTSRKSNQIAKGELEKLDKPKDKLENRLRKLVGSLEEKRERGNWIDHLMMEESNAAYGRK